MRWTLVGEQGSKRTDYFLKAANELGKQVRVVSNADCLQTDLSNSLIKLDPPKYTESRLNIGHSLTEHYIQQLQALSRQGGLHFLNHPDDILASLNKLECKQRLISAGVRTAQLLAEKVASFDELLALMHSRRMYSVFVKPLNGSGAAGVLAFRLQAKTGQMALYTSALQSKDGLVNTKKIHCLKSADEVKQTVNAILNQGAIVEQWVPKAVHEGKSYDLRVVWQFGKAAFTVARLSPSPITNLHLNNMAMAFDELKLTHSCVASIYDLCSKTMEQFPKLSYAGIDVLLAKGTLTPYVVEVNGQGDLIYQDIYSHNTIYKEQLKLKSECLNQSLKNA